MDDMDWSNFKKAAAFYKSHNCLSISKKKTLMLPLNA